jgi:hypothetical protein
LHKGSALGLDRGDLPPDQLEPLQLPDDFGLETRR